MGLYLKQITIDKVKALPPAQKKAAIELLKKKFEIQQLQIAQAERKAKKSKATTPE